MPLESLGLRVSLEAYVDISVGLEVSIFVVFYFVKEILMKNPIVSSRVWCGVAFVRAWWDTSNPDEGWT